MAMSDTQNFPGKRLETNLDWNDLVLTPQASRQLKGIRDGIKNRDRSRRSGIRCLFTGPSGTGKTLTATLLGKDIGRDVYRLDLSDIVNKWIGETEKNLSVVFDQAENSNWILFFDEADALLWKRSGASGSNDRYANLEVSHLLQRIESHKGIVILATNLKSNIDPSVSRRFQSVVQFATTPS